MNKQEILRHEREAVPIAQNAYEKFTIYYQSLDPEERESLNNYWIDSWDEVYIFLVGPGVNGMKATTFGSLYQEFNDSCIHSVGGSIAQLVLQLAPHTEFNASCIMAKRVFDSIKNNNDFENSQYVTATVENRGILRRILTKIAAHPIITSSIMGVGLGIGLTFLLSSTLCILLIPVFPIFFIALKEGISHYIINPIKRYFYPETDSPLNPSNDEANNNDQSPLQQNNFVKITCAPEEDIRISVTEVPELLPLPEAKIAPEDTVDNAAPITSISEAEEKNSWSRGSYTLNSFFGISRSKQSPATNWIDKQPSLSRTYGSMN